MPATARLSYVSLSPSTGSSGVASVLLCGLRKLELDFARLRQPDAVGDDFGVEAEAAILVAQPFGDAAARFRSGHVRLAGEMPQIAFRMRRVGNGAEFFFELAFGRDARGRKAGDAGRFLRAAGNRGDEEKQTGENRPG